MLVRVSECMWKSPCVFAVPPNKSYFLVHDTMPWESVAVVGRGACSDPYTHSGTRTLSILWLWHSSRISQFSTESMEPYWQTEEGSHPGKFSGKFSGARIASGIQSCPHSSGRDSVTCLRPTYLQRRLRKVVELCAQERNGIGFGIHLAQSLS